MKEDRISQRVDIELPAKFYFQDKPNAWIDASVVNISTHGFCFRTDAKYADAFNGKPIIHLGAAISKEESVELEIQVAWAGKTSSYNCLIGGEILDTSSADYQRILELYTRLFRGQAE